MKSRKKYKEIMIPKGTLLFHYAEDKKVHPIMRFGFCSLAAAMVAPDNNNGIIQVWVTKKDIFGVYFVSQVLSDGSKINATDDAFKSLMGVRICPLCVPLDGNPGREEFIEKLRTNFNINSWVTSVISRTEMELILFFPGNEKYVKFHSQFKDDCATMPNEQWDLYRTKSFRFRKFNGNYFNI